jgi:hypothetical protein
LRPGGDLAVERNRNTRPGLGTGSPPRPPTYPRRVVKSLLLRTYDDSYYLSLDRFKYIFE